VDAIRNRPTDGPARASLRAAARGVTGLVLTLLGLLVTTFALSHASPVDPVLQLLGDHASASSYAQARHALGLDQPLPLQLWHYLGRLAHGDLGVARSTGQPVRDDLLRVGPATLELATLALVVGAATGVLLGAVSAWRRGGVIDGVVRFVAQVGNSLPVFWVGLLALYLFYARLHWTGGPGRLDDAYQYTIDLPTGFVLIDAWRSGERGAFASALSHLVLPMLVLAWNAAANIARVTRTVLLNESGKEYVTLARAKGLGELRVLATHTLPNAAGTIVTSVALSYASLLEGAVLTETVFAWPGIGRYMTTALFAGDTPAILGATLTIGVCFVLVNAGADLVVRTLDPRVR
jgi:peptide/nickel transport system permease protein